MTTYISKEAKNGKMQYFRVDEDGKKKMIKRGEYEANTPAADQVQLIETECAEPAALIEIPAVEATEPTYTAEPIPARSE